MVLLRRIVRMGVHAAGAQPHPEPREQSNGYGGVPRMPEWPHGRHVEVEICCRGEVDPRTGYFLDIKEIDRAARGVLADAFARSLTGSAGGEVRVLASAAPVLTDTLGGRLLWVRWNVTPTYSIEVSPMAPHQQTALLRQKFEIAAAHRLHVPELSEEENRRLFGRCANPSAHGHNYIIEPCVKVAVAATGAPTYTLAELERDTLATIIDPFDHRNLNVDCHQFDQSKGGVNPSVENISRVFYTLLAPVIARHGGGGGVELQSLTVWETEKTCSTYPG